MQTTGHEKVLIVGRTVHISCTTILRGYAKIQWLLGGLPFPLESSTTQEVILPLELESTRLDGAMFTCRISWLDGAMYDETITLKVKGMIFYAYLWMFCDCLLQPFDNFVTRSLPYSAA